MFKRESWLHAFTPLGSSTAVLSSLDHVLSAIMKSDEDDLHHVKAIEDRTYLSQYLKISILCTLSQEEFSYFAGYLSEEEEQLIDRMMAIVNNQQITASAGSQGEIQNGDQCNVYDSLLSFLKRTEVILSIGGDDRLSIAFGTGSKVNKYLSSTIPRPRIINRGSCTCSSVTMDHYLLADATRREFLRAVLEKIGHFEAPTAENTAEVVREVFSAAQERLLSRLKGALHLSNTTSNTNTDMDMGAADAQQTSGSEAKAEVGAELVFFPSGSDAEYLPLVAALIRSHGLSVGDAAKIKVFNYVCAAGEVGSGTAAAAGGRHFSSLLPRGDTLPTADGLLEGMDARWVTVVSFKPRGKAGEVHLAEEAIMTRVRSDLAQDTCSVAVLHTVCGSKTGLVHPSADTVVALAAEFKERLIVVVDACQLRCDLRHVQRYVQQGYMVLATGSKFFTAPPFAGVVVVPTRIAQEIEAHLAAVTSATAEASSVSSVTEEGAVVCVVPAGLRQYLTRDDAPPSMPHLRRFLGANGRNDWVNLGLHLRWSCAADTMERYNALPREAVASFTALWVARVKGLIAQQAPYLQVLPEGRPDEACGDYACMMHNDMIAGVSGIVSVVVSVVDIEAMEEALAAVNAFSGFRHLIRLSAADERNAATAASQGEIVPVRTLSFDELKEFHLRMAADSAVGMQTGETARCMLGQPVKLADNGFAVVRIALGADMVISALEGTDTSAQLESVLRQDDAVVTKMAHLARTWHSAPSSTHSAQAPQGGKSVSLSDTNVKMTALDMQLLLQASRQAQAHSTLTGSVVPVMTAATAASVLQSIFPGTSRIPAACILYDLDAVDTTSHALSAAFTSCFPAGAKFTHCFATKSAPLTFLLHHAVQRGLGLETASLMEVKQALRCGCPPSRIVFDSPCKSTEELKFALQAGVMVNANSLTEVDRIAAVLRALQRDECFLSSSIIGLRVNPMVGAGTIDALSTATATSKFGVPCQYADQTSLEATTPSGRADLREQIVTTYVKYPFLRAIMCHVGSQGMPLASMVQGAECILALADEIDTRCRDLGEKGARITHVDIGGGLSANYASEDVSPTFAEYAALLAAQCGARLRASPHRVFVTEFGKALIAKCGVIATRVEECREFLALAAPTGGKESDTKPVLAMVQAGADLMLRTCYCPEKFPHRLAFLDAHKQPLTVTAEDVSCSSDAPQAPAETADASWSLTPSSVRPLAQVTVAGPLCFSGDVIVKDLPLPTPQAGDVCLVLDAGANTLSLFSRHCSRLSPAVFAFRRVTLRAPAIGKLRCEEEEEGVDKSAAVATGGGSIMHSGFAVACIREAESEGDVLRFWG